MSEMFEPVDAHDRDLALARRRALATFNAAGVLTAADVHVATNLGRLGGEPDASVLLAVALTVAGRAARVGLPRARHRRRAARPTSTCRGRTLDAWSAAIARSPLVAARGAALGARAALPRPLPRAGDAGPRRPAAARAASAPLVDADLLDAVAGARLPRQRLRRAAGRPARTRRARDDRHHRRPGHRQDDRRRGPAGRAARAGRGARRGTCASRWPRRPARPRPGSSRRSATPRRGSARRTRRGWPASAR